MASSHVTVHAAQKTRPRVNRQPVMTASARLYRLRPVMRQGTASSVEGAWTRYRSVDEARADAKQMYRDDRVLRVMLVLDSLGTFVEWIER